MDYLDDIITQQIKSLPSDDGIYENFKNNYNRLKRDIKSFNRNEELVKKIAIFPKLSKRISDLKKIKKSEKKLLDFTNKMDQVIRGIKNKHNKEDFDDQILLKILRASDVYGRSLDNTKGFLHYISIIDKKELPALKTLLDKYVKVEQGLIDLIQILSDDDTQLALIKKRIVKLEMESLYNLLSHKNVDFITEEYDFLIGRNIHYPTQEEITGWMKDLHIKATDHYILSSQSILNWLNNTCNNEKEKEEIINRHHETSDLYKSLVNFSASNNDIFVDVKHFMILAVK